jgi:hypothetical protein
MSTPNVKVRVTKRAVYLAGGQLFKAGDIVELSLLEASDAVCYGCVELVHAGDVALLRDASAAHVRRQLAEARRPPSTPDIGPDWSSMR